MSRRVFLLLAVSVGLLVGGLITGGGYLIRQHLIEEGKAYTSKVLTRRSSSTEVATAFVMGLRLNDPSVYEIVDPQLWPEIDEWMQNHQVQTCLISETGGNMGIGGYTTKFSVTFSCYVSRGELYRLRIEGILVEEYEPRKRHVIGWGEVIEGIH